MLLNGIPVLSLQYQIQCCFSLWVCQNIADIADPIRNPQDAVVRLGQGGRPQNLPAAVQTVPNIQLQCPGTL